MKDRGFLIISPYNPYYFVVAICKITILSVFYRYYAFLSDMMIILPYFCLFLNISSTFKAYSVFSPLKGLSRIYTSAYEQRTLAIEMSLS